MKNILIICGATFPPQHGVGGVRIAYFAKHLCECGWNIFIATRDYHKSHPLYNRCIDISSNVPTKNIFRTWIDASGIIYILMSVLHL